ncbi:MAG: hypothetical protein QOF60_731 [Actinomycetota bacterium]|jgi:hypothetical protein|nr:hypothetical protein [Actinomycetota bacterium]
MRNWQNVTIGDLGKALARYRPFVALVVVVLLLVVWFPGTKGREGTDLRAGGPGVTTPAQQDAAAETAAATDAAATATSQVSATISSGGTKAGTGATTPGKTTAGAGTGTAANPGAPLQVAAGVGPDCDLATGRIMVPTKFAPPCMPAFKGDNGGATSPQGVTKDTINVVVYRPVVNPATQAALKAAGAADDEKPTRDTITGYFDYFQAHYETYGRKINLMFKDGTADTAQDGPAKSDAIDVATTMKAFVSISEPNNAYVDELVARKVLCICTTSQPQDFYENRQPYVGYTTLMSSTQGYIHRAEYVGKRLARRKAIYAGDATYKTKDRTFALLYFETPDRAYKAGADFMERELRDKYGVPLDANLPFTGAAGPGSDPNKTQEQAGPIIQRLKNDGVTSVIFSGDPVTPAIFTKEATKQQYFPEWIITGSALVDTSLFGRTYDPAQWTHAFGISFLTARLPPELGDAYRLWNWHFTTNAAPPAGNTYPVIYAPIFSFFTGVHMAGPNLNPATFQQGLFNYPVSGAGITLPTLSFGDHGIWPKSVVKADLTAYDDVTEIYWDPQATGPDEVGHQGPGMYRYVNDGKRYLPGKHPTTDPQVFDGKGITIYNQVPPQDQAPNYPHKHYK